MIVFGASEETEIAGVAATLATVLASGPGRRYVRLAVSYGRAANTDTGRYYVTRVPLAPPTRGPSVLARGFRHGSQWNEGLSSCPLTQEASAMAPWLSEEASGLAFAYWEKRSHAICLRRLLLRGFA